MQGGAAVTRTPTLSRKQFARRRLALAPALARKRQPRKAGPHPDPLPHAIPRKAGPHPGPLPQAGEGERGPLSKAGEGKIS
jgi:hypothetical protein